MMASITDGVVRCRLIKALQRFDLDHEHGVDARQSGRGYSTLTVAL